MAEQKIYSAWYFRSALIIGLVLFFGIHFFYDPYRVVQSIASSSETHALRVGDPEVRLAVLTDVKPGALYRAAVNVAWDSVEAAGPPYKNARVVFASYDKRGHWIPSPHSVCGVIGSGEDSFEAVLPIPEGAASTRLSFQHLGLSGWIRLDHFSLQQVELKRSTPFIFRALQIVWGFLAIWAVCNLRLWNRASGIAVILVAGLITVGMLLPNPLVKGVLEGVDDFIRPVEGGVPAQSSPVSGAIDQASPDRITVALQSKRSSIANWVQVLDVKILSHAGLFLFLGIVCGIYFLRRRPGGRGLLPFLTGGIVFAMAAELLQVTELTRKVRADDIGVNVTAWLIGLVAVALMARGLGRRTEDGGRKTDDTGYAKTEDVGA